MSTLQAIFGKFIKPSAQIITEDVTMTPGEVKALSDTLSSFEEETARLSALLQTQSDTLDALKIELETLKANATTVEAATGPLNTLIAELEPRVADLTAKFEAAELAKTEAETAKATAETELQALTAEHNTLLAAAGKPLRSQKAVKEGDEEPVKRVREVNY